MDFRLSEHRVEFLVLGPLTYSRVVIAIHLPFSLVAQHLDMALVVLSRWPDVIRKSAYLLLLLTLVFDAHSPDTSAHPLSFRDNPKED